MSLRKIYLKGSIATVATFSITYQSINVILDTDMLMCFTSFPGQQNQNQISKFPAMMTLQNQIQIVKNQVERHSITCHQCQNMNIQHI